MKRAKGFFDKDKISKLIKPIRKKVIILAGVIVIILAGNSVLGGKKGAKDTMAVRDDIVTRGDVTVSITGSASVEPLERFEIIPKVSGDIIYCPYEVGDAVNEDDVLYMFDSSDTDLTVERQRISMQQSENNYRDALAESEKLELRAKNDGVISGLSIKLGQEVSAGTKIADVNETKVLEAEVPFTAAQIAYINVGDSAIVASSKHQSQVNGRVTHISSASVASADGSTLYNVTISLDNPGAFYAGMEIGASVNGQISPGSGTLTNSQTGTVITETKGTVLKINYKNGDYVKKGTVIATLKSQDIQDKITDGTLSYKSAELSMRQTEKDLENYNITSPISGTVIKKNSKAGDTIDKTNASTTMMVVADISKLKFELAIDELDVSKVTEGQEVLITCDAIPGENFTGVVTNVSVEGTATNGVTTYSAQVEIPEPGNLRPSMNIDAEIIIESAQDVLMIPTEDVKTVGGKSYVFVKKGTENKDNSPKKGEDIEVAVDGRPVPDGMDSGKGEKQPDGKAFPDGRNMHENAGGKGNMIPEAPDGYVAQEVEIGISNEDYTEIISGLSEGQEIYSMYTGSSSDSMMSGFMNIHGGMGGGMPSGGMGRGMPSGGGMPGGMR